MENGAVYLLMDVGGTEVKINVADQRGRFLFEGSMNFPADAGAAAECIFDRMADMLEMVMERAGGCPVAGVGLAFPGPFDYERGISLMKGLDKYDSIYGVPIAPQLKKRIPRLHEAKFIFLHDIEAFAIGESRFGEVKTFRRFLCLCIGTGAGSAFVEDGKVLKEGKGVPHNSWIYDTPFKASVIDDYISARGLGALAQKLCGEPLEGLELYRRCTEHDERAIRCFQAFGENLAEAATPFLDSFHPEAVVLGGQISKSYPWFGGSLGQRCTDRGIRIFLEADTSTRAMQGLYMTMRGV